MAHRRDLGALEQRPGARGADALLDTACSHRAGLVSWATLSTGHWPLIRDLRYALKDRSLIRYYVAVVRMDETQSSIQLTALAGSAIGYE